jgi:hypothetical protein
MCRKFARRLTWFYTSLISFFFFFFLKKIPKFYLGAFLPTFCLGAFFTQILFGEFPTSSVQPSAAMGSATSLLENADFTRQNVATPEANQIKQ